MYKTVNHTPSLKDILARAAGKPVAITPVVYCDRDIQRARSVLDRLLIKPKREVSTIYILPKQISED